MMLKLRKAFTLVELVIVIAVIAILAAVLIPTFSGVVDKANLIKDEQVARNLTNQIKMSSATTTINNESDLWTALEEIYSGEYIEELKTKKKELLDKNSKFLKVERYNRISCSNRTYCNSATITITF